MSEIHQQINDLTTKDILDKNVSAHDYIKLLNLLPNVNERNQGWTSVQTVALLSSHGLKLSTYLIEKKGAKITLEDVHVLNYLSDHVKKSLYSKISPMENEETNIILNYLLTKAKEQSRLVTVTTGATAGSCGTSANASGLLASNTREASTPASKRECAPR